VMEILWINKQ